MAVLDNDEDDLELCPEGATFRQAREFMEFKGLIKKADEQQAKDLALRAFRLCIKAQTAALRMCRQEFSEDPVIKMQQLSSDLQCLQSLIKRAGNVPAYNLSKFEQKIYEVLTDE